MQILTVCDVCGPTNITQEQFYSMVYGCQIECPQCRGSATIENGVATTDMATKPTTPEELETNSFGLPFPPQSK
ncbi:hypothetical protein C121_3 [Stenotrophomonas phage C121]|uniref:hypothetical protein n=1 Tax=Stenotrophomonas phage C121 TaxID=2914029 RepID=UPI0023295A04|nr:hypothetical protein PP752_gp03 [Stenotrophomonas phage C121]UKL14736.1 hypothetical protein C121_3 [Stenotrophomonas phage C121]